MKITMIGTGYVGLVSGACFADMGSDVLCLDLDLQKIALLQGGGIPIFEPGLEELVRKNVKAGRLRFTASYDEGIAHADLLFIAVGTPPGEDGSADLRHVLAAAKAVGERMNRPVIVVDKSTVPVGTAGRVRAVVSAALERRNKSFSFAVVSNPEFLKEGVAIEDFMRPDRIIIGSDDVAAIDVMRQLYAPFSRNHNKMVVMDVRSAELTKYAANAMLATRISFMNELANLAESVGADIEAVRLGIGSDPRIGADFLYPGCGYGGSCFPKDVKALLSTACDHGNFLHVLEAVEKANQAQKFVLFKKMETFFAETGGLRGKTVAIWGLSFKPNTDDMREAPSRVLISQLLAAGAMVRAYDPVAGGEARKVFGPLNGIQICGSAKEAVEGADFLAVVTEWKEFSNPDFEYLASELSDGVIFDGRNLYEPAFVRVHGLKYLSVGRAAS